jgi:hypothetical protein
VIISIANSNACGSLQNFILERNAFRIVFLKPGLCGILGSEDLEVILVANLFARVDVYPHGHFFLSAARRLGEKASPLVSGWFAG